MGKVTKNARAFYKPARCFVVGDSSTSGVFIKNLRLD
jgi:hypothetical protein